MHQLPLVGFGQGLDGLESEDCSAADEQVKIIGFAEGVEPHFDCHLALRLRDAEGDLPLVNLFVK